MTTTDKESCRILVAMLERHGITQAVVSPGSRNAPLMLALNASASIVTTVVIDERSAAFIAMGKALISGKPVVLVCTSGTALLNYAPAVAEAYYRKIPLIVVSADRPMEWIDQDDSQTLRQFEALANYVKGNYNIPADCSRDTIQWYVNRIINDALLSAVSGRPAPVHINIQLDAPLGGTIHQCDTSPWTSRAISMIHPSAMLSSSMAAKLARSLLPHGRVLVIVGFHTPSPQLRKALESLTRRGNVAIMTETISNVLSSRFINEIDSVLSTMSEEEMESMRPDIVITCGGAIVSRFIKQYFRRLSPKEHWHVGLSNTTIDCFRCLTRRIEMDATYFFSQIDDALFRLDQNGEKNADSGDLLSERRMLLNMDGDVNVNALPGYYGDWMRYLKRSADLHKNFLESVPWSDLRAVSVLMKAIPQGTALQLSNGTSVRYAQLFPALQCYRADGNRGVSGIDGSTSTAVGAASADPERMTLLLTGDMSAQYDISALAAPCIPPTFRMAVLCNGGGGIFRFIDATRSMPILERFLVADRPFPLRQLAEAYGFGYMEVRSDQELTGMLPEFFSPSVRPIILAIYTPGEISADILREYLSIKAND